jgi:lysyl endopeptidase
MSLAKLSHSYRNGYLLILSLVAFIAFSSVAVAASPLAQEGPIGPTLSDKGTLLLPALSASPVDEVAARAEDQLREEDGLPPRFALPQETRITPESDGSWIDLDSDFQLWRLRVQAPGALSLNFGFTGYELPKGSRLSIYPADYKGLDDVRGVRVFSEQDNETHGELWTPVVISNDVIIELLLPTASRNDYTLELTAINRGYRFFGEDLYDKSGSCNIDVVCPEGDDWRSEINSVGVISTGGSTFCTGSMLNNTAEDESPYFLTANHCGISTSNAASLVVYWNFQSPTCGQQGGGTLNQFMTGSTHLASSAASDFTLVLMDDPVDPEHNVTFAGWDRSTTDPPSVVAIHHPSTDEKSISFEYDQTSTTTYLQNAIPGDGSHIRVTDWDLGTTEPGSSGSPLFDQNHRVVGQLHGGYASCTSATSDWYGRLSMSFSAIAQYLDPTNSGAMAIDTLDPDANVGMKVTPGTNLVAAGNAGGPFTPSSIVYTLENKGVVSLDYSVTSDAAWTTVTNGSGTISVGGNAQVTVALNSGADSLPNGLYTGQVTFTNLTDGYGDTIRSANLQVGVPELVYSYNMDSDPIWDMQGQWAYGVPTGGGGEHGNVDPTSGATGNSVIGYNLNGDYTNDMAETHLTTTSIDCTDLTAVTLKFQRWLNVEQPSYDHAYIRVSTDGTNFSTIWENGSEVADTGWSQQVFDLSGVADGAATLYVRWTMGITDSSWLYSGWNIDDVEIWGLTSDVVSATGDVPGFQLTLGNYPNPFNPMTKVSFGIERDGQAVINIYDVQGHLVRRLVDGNLTAGTHQATWDGRDDSGQQVGSGVYFAQLVSGGQVAEHKMVLLK